MCIGGKEAQMVSTLSEVTLGRFYSVCNWGNTEVNIKIKTVYAGLGVLISLYVQLYFIDFHNSIKLNLYSFMYLAIQL